MNGHASLKEACSPGTPGVEQALNCVFVADQGYGNGGLTPAQESKLKAVWPSGPLSMSQQEEVLENSSTVPVRFPLLFTFFLCYGFLGEQSVCNFQC